MPRIIRQTSFAGGEITPSLHARTDLAKFFTSLKTCENFFVTQHGILMNRSGTRFVAETKGSGPIRLIPFVFNNDQTFVLEFGAGYIRFIHDGALVGGPATTALEGEEVEIIEGAVMELASPYGVADLNQLKYAQMGDVITIVHPLYAPRELKRHANTHWTLDTISIVRPAGPANVGWVFTNSPTRGINPTSNVAMYDENYTYHGGYTCLEATQDLYPPGPVIYRLWRSLQDGNVGHHPHDGANVGVWWTKEWEWQIGGIEGVPTLNHLDTPGRPAKKWRWVVTAVDANGIESLPSDELNPNSDPGNLNNNDLVCLATDRPVSFAWDAIPETKYYNVYRGLNGLFGYVGDSALPSFTDDAQAPDYTNTPPTAADPFSGAGNYPSTIAYFQQRRWFGGTLNNPQTIWGSKTGDFKNFSVALIPKADDAVEFTLASRQLETIRNLLGLRSLLLLTASGEWSVSGGQSGPVTPANVEITPHGYRGSAILDPIAVGNVALYVQAMGTVIRELLYDFSSDSYVGNDLTVLATHLFQGHRIVDWCFAPLPYSTLWAVREDGALLGCTYLREHEVVAWHKHDTLGAFERICAVPEGSEHAVYVVARRGEKQYIERFCSRQAIPRLPDGKLDVKRGVFLDSARSFEGETVLSGLDHLEGYAVLALADGNVCGPYVVENGAIDISGEMPDGASLVHVGLGYVSEAESLDLAAQQADLRAMFKNVFAADVEVIDSRGLKVGTAHDDMREWRQRSVKDGWDAIEPYNGFIQVRVPSAYSRDARLILRQEDPLPVTILGIGREADVN